MSDDFHSSIEQSHAGYSKNNAYLHKKIPVLNKGFVCLLDYMGDDTRIVQAARISYASGTKSYRQDEALIHYLYKNAHTSVFEHVLFTFHVKMPIFVARQWLRHRTAKINEISARYSIMEPEFFFPETDQLKYQSQDNKQARSEQLLTEQDRLWINQNLQECTAQAYQLYQQLLEKGLARELARSILPVSLYTEIFWTMDLHNLLHFLHLRLDSHAQREIQSYAQILMQIVQSICPIAVQAFQRYRLESIQLDSQEQKALKALWNNEPIPLTGKALNQFQEKIKFLTNK